MPSATVPASTAQPCVFELKNTSVTSDGAAFVIVHRGETVGRLVVGDEARLPFADLEEICRQVIAIEMRYSDTRATAVAEGRGYVADEAARLRTNRRRINKVHLARQALKTLALPDILKVAQLAREDNAGELAAALRRVTGGALRRNEVLVAMGSKTLEILGADTIAATATDRAAQRRAAATTPGRSAPAPERPAGTPRRVRRDDIRQRGSASEPAQRAAA